MRTLLEPAKAQSEHYDSIGQRAGMNKDECEFRSQSNPNVLKMDSVYA